MCEDINCYPWVGKLLHFKWQRVDKYNFMFSYAPLDILLTLGQKSLGQTKDPFSPIVCSQLWLVVKARFKGSAGYRWPLILATATHWKATTLRCQ